MFKLNQQSDILYNQIGENEKTEKLFLAMT